MRKTLIANKSFRYAGKPLLAGDTFDASGRDARVLTAIGKASHTYQTRVLTAGRDAESDDPQPEKAETPQKRTYTRKADK